MEIKAHAHLSPRNRPVLEWQPAIAPRAPEFEPGRLCGCSYCGSMHPAELAAAIGAGATVHWADFKYGWPHKLYVDGIPNPHAGIPEVRCSGSGYAEPDKDPLKDWTQQSHGRWSWREKPKPASATTHGKFYTEHLQDATPEDREVIERAAGISFTFDVDGTVTWRKFE